MSIKYLFPFAHTLWYFGLSTFVFPLEDLQEPMPRIKIDKIINRILTLPTLENSFLFLLINILPSGKFSL